MGQQVVGANFVIYFLCFWSFGFLNTWIPNFYLRPPAIYLQGTAVGGLGATIPTCRLRSLNSQLGGHSFDRISRGGSSMLFDKDMDMHFFSLENGMIDPVDPSHLILFKHLLYLYTLYYSACITDIL